MKINAVCSVFLHKCIAVCVDSFNSVRFRGLGGGLVSGKGKSKIMQARNTDKKRYMCSIFL